MDPWLQIHGQQVDPLPEDLVDSVEIWSGGCFFFSHFLKTSIPKLGRWGNSFSKREDMDSFCGGMLKMLKPWALLYQQPRDPRGHGFSGQRNAEVSAASTAVAVGREAIKGQGWIQMLLGYIQTHQHQLGRNLIIKDFHVYNLMIFDFHQVMPLSGAYLP